MWGWSENRVCLVGYGFWLSLRGGARLSQGFGLILQLLLFAGYVGG